MILLTTILFGLARGLYEGMIMMPGGVRDHVAFWLYHTLGVAMLVAFGRLVYLVLKRQRHWLYIAGLALILWECTEVGYGIARTDIPIMSQEHLTIFDVLSIYLYGWQVWALHVIRILAGISLLCVKSKPTGQDRFVLFV